MLIYLDSMVAQYIADYIDYVLAIGGYLTEDGIDQSSLPTESPKFMAELHALGQLVFLEQLGNDWCFAATPHLMKELRAGRPTAQQEEFYTHLETTWRESGWTDVFPLDSTQVGVVERSIIPLGLKDADRLHLAQAIVLGVAWFLTNDSAIIESCRNAELRLRVCRPSECLDGISVGLFLRTDND